MRTSFVRKGLLRLSREAEIQSSLDSGSLSLTRAWPEWQCVALFRNPIHHPDLRPGVC